MIDFTPAQSRAYSEHIEQPGVSQDEIDHKAIQIMRGLSTDDVSQAIYHLCETIKSDALAMRGATTLEERALRRGLLGGTVIAALNRYCQDIAKRVLEA